MSFSVSFHLFPPTQESKSKLDAVELKLVAKQPTAATPAAIAAASATANSKPAMKQLEKSLREEYEKRIVELAKRLKVSEENNQQLLEAASGNNNNNNSNGNSVSSSLAAADACKQLLREKKKMLMEKTQLAEELERLKQQSQQQAAEMQQQLEKLGVDLDARNGGHKPESASAKKAGHIITQVWCACSRQTNSKMS